MKIKNITGLVVAVIGQSISPSEYYTLQTIEEIRYLRDSILLDLAVNDKIVLNINNIDLTKQETINFLDRDLFVSTNITGALNAAAAPSSNNAFATLNDVGAAAIKGNFSVWFGYNGSASNRWLEISRSVPSSDTLIPVPANLSLKAVTFSNSNSNVGTDIELYKNGIVSGDKIYTLQIRNKTYLYTEYNSTPINLLFGDRLACYAKNVGGQSTPSSPVVCFSFVITSLGSGSGGE